MKIYQEDNQYKFMPFKAIVSDKEFYIENKINFEQRLLNDLQEEEDLKAINECREPNTITLPTITYMDVTHTLEESNRLLECQGSNANLDDVRHYVETGAFPTGNHSLSFLETLKLKSDLINVQDAINMLLQL